MRASRVGRMAVGLVTLVVASSASPVFAEYDVKERSCATAVAKAYGKLHLVVLKNRAKCRALDLAGKVDDPNDCDPLPAKTQAKVDILRDKFVAKIAKSCQGSCSISTDKTCVSDIFCPPKHTASPADNSIAERCQGFNIANLDWPGPYCESVLGGRIEKSEDLGECLATLSDVTIGAMEDAIFGDMNQATAVGSTAAKCAAGISKAAMVAASKAHAATAACRDIRRQTTFETAWSCATTDPDAQAAVDKAITLMRDKIGKSCADADVAALPDLCASGGFNPTDVAGAQDCIESMVRELATEERAPSRHVWSPLGMMNVTHPHSAKGYCGDGIVESRRDERTGVGEECDLDVDDACPGQCRPPGDLFECTCGNIPRERFVVDGERADSDAGWKGTSHDATHNDGFGYVSALSNCTCSDFDQATCLDNDMGDHTCDVKANLAPRCSDDLSGTETCDERGNGNGIAENRDCFRCDDDSINAGALCAQPLGFAANETLCQSQCFEDATGLPVDPQTPCLAQVDCGEGRSCKGRCDSTITCETMTEGSPLPLVSAAISVCIVLEYKTDITGTKNMVTGESALTYTTRSNIRLGTAFTVPCPGCGGMCRGGANDGESCYGRCDANPTACLVDSDCTGPGDTACLESAADCTGGACSLDLRCSDGPRAGQICVPDAVTALGVVSHDCLPDPNTTLSGTGVIQINGGPVTTETVQFPSGPACTDTAWHNYTCPCPANSLTATGVPTRPNLCAAACNGGGNAGKGCALGSGGVGIFSTCVGGTDNGFVCDQDGDCEGGGTCSSVKRACTAGSVPLGSNCNSNTDCGIAGVCTISPLSECIAGSNVKIGTTCSVNSDCGGGGECAESCPGARCVPQCSSEGRCTNGMRDGDLCASVRDCAVCTGGNPYLAGKPCARSEQCDTTYLSGDGVCAPEGGVTCDVSDTEDGLCTAGPRDFRCTGDGFTALPCSFDNGSCQANLCTSGSPSKIGQACVYAIDCLENGVPIAEGCEAGDDGVLGNGDDRPGAGDCEPRPRDCYVNNGFAEGGDTWNGNGSPSDVKLVTTFCTPPTGLNTIDPVSGFGGPSRVRRWGAAFVNVPSMP